MPKDDFDRTELTKQAKALLALFESVSASYDKEVWRNDHLREMWDHELFILSHDAHHAKSYLNLVVYTHGATNLSNLKHGCGRLYVGIKRLELILYLVRAASADAKDAR